MRVLGYILLTFVCLVLALGTFAYVAAPVDLVRDQVVAAVKRETGRDLIIRGGTSFAVYPNLGVALGDVELSAPPEMGGAPFLKVASLKLAIPLLALLQRQVSIDEFVLESPEIDLRVDANGRESWSFARAGGGEAASDAAGDELSPEVKEFIRNSNQSGKSVDGSEAGSGLAGLRLGDVRISNGTIRYTDARSGTSETVSDVNVRIGLDALDAPLSLTGDATWKTRRVPIEATLTSLDTLLAKRPVQIALSIAPQDLALTFAGIYDPSNEGVVGGKLGLKSEDVAAIAGWLTGKRGAAGPIKSVAIAGTVNGNQNGVSLKNAKFTINDLTGSGTIAARLSGRTRIDGTVQVGAIRTASFLGGPSSASGATGQGGGTATTTTAAQRPKSDGWDSTPIDFKPLRTLDANLSVSYKSLAHDEIRLGAGKMTVGLDRGVLRVNANPLSLYNGAARGALVVDARNAVAAYSAWVVAEKISALPLLKAVADFNWLSGATTMRLDLKGRGQSQRQMIKTMDGTGSFSFADGAIEGLNIAKIMRGVQQGRFNDFDRVSGEKTDFSALSASFKIAQGVASNSDLRLLGPLVRASGAGQINLGGQALDYRLAPKLVASLQGQGSGAVSGLEIPLKISGPWANPKVVPDLDSVLKNPEAAVKSLGGLVDNARKKLKSGKAKDLLEGVLGGGATGGDSNNSLGGLLGGILQ